MAKLDAANPQIARTSVLTLWLAPLPIMAGWVDWRSSNNWLLVAIVLSVVSFLHARGAFETTRGLLPALAASVFLRWFSPAEAYPAPLFLLACFGLLAAIARKQPQSKLLQICAALAAAALLPLAMIALIDGSQSEHPGLQLWVALSAGLLAGHGLRHFALLVAMPVQRPAFIAALLQAGVAVLVIAGWLLQSATVVQAATGQVPMQFNTALCHGLSGLALLLVLYGRQRVGLLLVTPVWVIAALSLLEEISGRTLGISELFWRHRIVGESAAPGRMAFVSASAFLLGMLGVSLVALARRRPALWPLAWTCGLLIGVSALAVLAGNVLGIPQARAFGGHTPMALLTALAFLAQGFALLFAGRDEHNHAWHQQIWLPILVLCGTLVLSLQLGMAVLKQRDDLAQRAVELRADAVLRGISRGLDSRILALWRMAERLATQERDAAQVLFQADAALYARDYPSLAGLALLTGGLEIQTEFLRPQRQIRWTDLHHNQLQVLRQVSAHRSAQLGAPFELSAGDYASILAIPLSAPSQADSDSSYLLAVLAWQDLFKDLLDDAPDAPAAALQINDQDTVIFASTNPALSGPPLIRKLTVHGRNWQLQFSTPARGALDRITAMLLLAGLLSGTTLALLLRFAGLAGQRARESAAHQAELEEQLRHGQSMRAALSESEGNLGSVLSSMTDAVMLLDANWRFVFLNAQAGHLIRRVPADLLGKSIWDEFPEAVASPFQHAYERAVREQTTEVVESYFAPLDAWFEARAYPHRDGLAVYFRDVSANKRAELELRASSEALQQAVAELQLRNRELQDFAFVASHDLQEPLRKIRTFADRLLTRGGSLEPQAQDYVQRMAAAAERMQTLIEDLLALSRVRKRNNSFGAVDLNLVLAAVLEDLSELIRRSAAQISSSSLPTIQGDPTQLRQLLQNLLVNALKFRNSERALQIHIQARRLDDAGEPKWSISVQDNGIGFDNKHAERIFVPFQRLHGRNEYEGTGIGLAIVRRIVERHRGQITAQGSPGVGACFTVVLPQTQIGAS